MQYTVKKIDAPLILDGNINKSQWESANELTIDNYPWYKGGDKQKTSVKLLHNNTSIFLLFVCEDKHSYSENTALNSLVCLDSCVEFFADPGTGSYINLEMNCCGTVLLGYGPDRYSRILVNPEHASQIKIFKSVTGKTKAESADDKQWLLEVEVPVKMIEDFIKVKIGALSGQEWKANFFRCGGKTDDQYASWLSIQAPKPDFHRPEYFGKIIF
ncbi:MAG: hypothetical protein A2252_00200 [Elusimicrobia bacterium RIFOXYA2_FULL_39_19]|nr:MAG: hypothetical protein A2252_00200 [Elusimicrobia bacterium RIFOXYA2_FULL_39_19]